MQQLRSPDDGDLWPGKSSLIPDQLYLCGKPMMAGQLINLMKGLHTKSWDDLPQHKQ